jgi:mono/diheme cytochrome c family protein
MGSRSYFTAAALTLPLLACGVIAAQDGVDYLRQIKPVLTERCVACHGVLQQQGGLRLDTAAFALKGGRSGPAVRRGNPDASLLIRRVTAPEHGGRMPPEGEPLKPEEVEALQTWIRQNARAPANERPEQDPRDHWSFRPVRRPPVPKVRDVAWRRNPIDAFLAQRHQQQRLKAQPEAPRLVLIRRLYLDLIGLPPSPEELKRANTDPASDWYERLVERLMDDPRRGERWARHWMDIWRYSDWWGLGDQLRNSQQHT